MRKFLGILLSGALVATLGLAAPAHSSTERTAVRVSPNNSAAVSGYAAAASATPKRHTAMRFARSQQRKWYCYGGEGPSCYDCSGLVQRAYAKAGLRLPRTTGSMLASSKLKRISLSQAKWGDLVFTHPGHVGFFSHRKNGVTWLFGARKTGTRIWWYGIYSGQHGYPRAYHVRGAG